MSSKSATRTLPARSPQNIAMGVAAIALSLLAWQASGRNGFALMALGWLALLPAWSARTAQPPAPGQRAARWPRALVGPGIFLIAAGLFQILAR